MEAIIALTAGALILAQMMVNAELGKVRGAMVSARWNFLSATAALLVLGIVTNGSVSLTAYRGEFTLGMPLAMLAVSALAVVITFGTNWVAPKLSAVRLTLLVFAGQMLAALALDFSTGKEIAPRSAVGLCLIVSGIAIDSMNTGKRVAGKDNVSAKRDAA